MHGDLGDQRYLANGRLSILTMCKKYESDKMDYFKLISGRLYYFVYALRVGFN